MDFNGKTNFAIFYSLLISIKFSKKMCHFGAYLDRKIIVWENRKWIECHWIFEFVVKVFANH